VTGVAGPLHRRFAGGGVVRLELGGKRRRT
jgi:hypothetical protein